MKRNLPKVRPGSRAAGRVLVEQSDYRDLIRRRESLVGLVRTAASDIADDELRLAQSTPAVARQLELKLVQKRKFLAALEARLKEVEADMAIHEAEQAAILAKFQTRPIR